jgi:hypothetical protein
MVFPAHHKGAGDQEPGAWSQSRLGSVKILPSTANGEQGDEPPFPIVEHVFLSCQGNVGQVLAQCCYFARNIERNLPQKEKMT